MQVNHGEFRYILVNVWYMGVIWICCNVESKYKNFAYNILDIISKNFYGLFIAYTIYQKRIHNYSPSLITFAARKFNFRTFNM